MSHSPVSSQRHFCGLLALFIGLLVLAHAQNARAQLIVEVVNNSDAGAGTLRNAIDLVSDAGNQDEENFILFNNAVNNLTLSLEEELTAIDIGVDGTVELDAFAAPGLRINKADPDDDFDILHVSSGHATLVGVNISGGDFVVDADAKLGFRYQRNVEIQDAIKGAGTVVKEGSGRLALSGDNSAWTGRAEIVEGELIVDHLSLPVDADIGEDTALTFFIEADGGDKFYSGKLTGDGELYKAGDGVLQLIGAPTEHTGGTFVREGTLLAASDKLVGDVNATTGSFDGDISGTGALRMSGLGELTLAGDNDFTGGLTVEDGRLIGTTLNIPGAVTLENAGATLVFDQASDASYAGAVSGAGGFVKRGAGILTLSGTHSRSGQTLIEAGTLRGNVGNLGADIAVSSRAVVDFDNGSGTESFAGSVTGAGEFFKSGAGLLTLDSALLHTGTTRVRGGALQLNADLAGSDVLIESGGELRGGATLGQNLNVFGRVTPGPGFGTLQVDGDVTFQTGSTLAITIDPTQNSRLEVAGTTHIAGGTVEVDVLAGDYNTAVISTILTSAGGITGAFPFTAPSFAFLDIEATTVGNAVQVRVERNANGLAPFADTPNQQATAAGLAEMLADGTPDAARVEQSLATLTEEEVPEVLDLLAGETLAAFSNLRMDNALLFSDMLSRRFNAGRFRAKIAPSRRRPQTVYRPRPPADTAPPTDVDATPPVDAGPTTDSFGPARSDGGFGAWIEPFGVFGDLDGGDLAASIESNLYGAMAGFDYQFAERETSRSPALSGDIRIGWAAGYTRTGLEGASGALSGHANSYQTGLYGAYATDLFYVGAAGRYAYSDMSSERRIAFGDIDRTAVGRFDGHEGGAFIEAGMHLGNPRSAYFHPLVNFQYSHVGQGAFDEMGADSLDLEAATASHSSLRSKMGVRLSRVFTLQGDYGMEPEVQLAWGHEFGDLDREITTRFSGANNPTEGFFTSDGAHLDRNEVIVGAGYVMRVSNVPLLSMNYAARIGSSFTQHTISAALLFAW